MLRPVIQINRALSGDYDKDKIILMEIAESPTTAANAYLHAEVVMRLCEIITHDTPSAPNYPERSGPIRKVFDELFPIAYFAKLHFLGSNEVTICWHNGNQNFDATVEDQRKDSSRSSIRYLEVTTLQDRQDAELLTRLAEDKTVYTEGESVLADHLRKVESLRTALKKKGKKKYPPNTALLVYTDEDRFQSFSFGPQSPQIDRKSSFGDVLKEMPNLLAVFSEVFVYSKHEIYCSLSASQEPSGPAHEPTSTRGRDTDPSASS